MPSAAGGVIDRSVGHSAFPILPTVPQPASADFIPQITFRILHSAFPQITNTLLFRPLRTENNIDDRTASLSVHKYQTNLLLVQPLSSCDWNNSDTVNSCCKKAHCKFY